MIVRPWLREGRYHALAPEIEIGWAPILGPSGLAVLRRANILFRQGHPAPEAGLLGRLVGLRPTTAHPQRTSVGAALRRLERFHVAYLSGDVWYVAVRADLPVPNLRTHYWPEDLERWAASLVEAPPVAPRKIPPKTSVNLVDNAR